MRLRYKVLLAALLVVAALFVTGAIWVQNVGLLPGSAIVFASNSPAIDRFMAGALKPAYGARIGVCDGVADNEEIQAAIDALSAGGGTVHLSKGTFHLGKITVDLPLQSQIIVKSDIVLEGSGWGTVLRPINGLTLPQESSVIAFHDYPTANYDRATVRDLQIDGNKANVVSQICGITYYSVYDTVVENVYVKNTKGHGIQPYGGGGRHRIINNLVTGAFVIGIYVDDVTDCVVVGNTIINSQYNNIWIDGPNAKRNTIVGNICIGGQYSIGFVRGSSYNTVTGNNFYNAGARAVDFEGLTADSHDNIVSGNIITPGSGVPAVVLGSTAACNKNIITGNVMVVTGATAAVIIRNASSNNLISQNRISTANGYSVTIAADSNNNIINENILTSTAGQYISDAGTGTIVRDNQGYLTENSGTATVLNTTTTIVVAHGLATAPTRVLLTARLWSAAAKAWVTDIGAANFTINVDADPGAGTAIFDWKAQVGEG